MVCTCKKTSFFPQCQGKFCFYHLWDYESAPCSQASKKVLYLHLQILWGAALFCSNVQQRQLHRWISGTLVPLPPRTGCYHNVTGPGSALTVHSAFSKVSVPQLRAAFTCKQVCLPPFQSSKICQTWWREREATNKDFWHLSCFPQTRAGSCPIRPRERGSSWY